MINYKYKIKRKIKVGYIHGRIRFKRIAKMFMEKEIIYYCTHCNWSGS